nr:RagB/SusD family nutrient uptake outer membrane protein [Arachidicoccus sp. BS20]
MTGCSKILKETPRSTFTPAYFQTEAGVEGGLTSLYADLRLWGSGYFLNANQDGTDESTWGGNSDNNIWQLDFSGKSTIDPQSSNTGFLWQTAFPAINTASGVIENGTEAGISASLLAEAYFFRGFYYFYLVQTYGGVPLDLGAGELKFNTSTVRTSVRNTVPEVYTKAIFPDLLQAINNLGDSRLQGGVSKTAAQLYLAKAYLTYGWWLQNPNNIPTYPAADRTDPDGHNAVWYFQQAYDVATAAIANPSKGYFGDAQTFATFGLQPTFYDVSNGANDRNSEILLYADHTQSSEQYNGASLSYSSGALAGPDNFIGWFEQFNYTSVFSSTSNTSWATVASVQRSDDQSLGRPWTMNAPPQGVFYNTFADKANDTRFDGTFVTSYRSNFSQSGLAAKYSQFYGANYLPLGQDDAVFTFLPEDVGGVDYSNSVFNSGIGAGVLPGRADFVVEPSHISRTRYPGNWKIGPYRTDANGGLGNPNGSSTRPVNIAKFSELYLIAAEAAVKGATGSMSARDLVNVLRARAGKQTFSNGLHKTVSIDNSAAMVAATPATIDINYILAERSREYFGEGYRWLDLVRTQKWNELAGSFTIVDSQNASDWSNAAPKTITRTITPQNYLRPIPTSQLNAMDMSADALAAYQNPGYN